MKVVYVLSLILTFSQLSFADVPFETVTFGLPRKRPASPSTTNGQKDFKYLWLSSDGSVHNESAPGRLEIAATAAITEEEHQTGAYIVKLVTANMPPEIFANLTMSASVGLFTWKDKTTIFPEYAKFIDRPECKGTCEDACSNTCTDDGRKYDALPGVGGLRATCVNENFMCYKDDGYRHTHSVLVHEFAHTIHKQALKQKSTYYEKIHLAYENARAKNIWDDSSYAMANELEYFAVASNVFFNADKYNKRNTETEMSSCGDATKPCANENAARFWLKLKDRKLFEILSYIYTNNRPTLPGKLNPCVSL